MKQRIVLEFEREDDDPLDMQAILDQHWMGRTFVNSENTLSHQFEFVLDKVSAIVRVNLQITALKIDPLSQTAHKKLEEP